MPDLQRYFTDLVALENRIARFTSQLVHINMNSLNDARAVVVARSFTAVAIILLHRRFATHEQTSRQKCLAAANAMVATLDAINVQNLAYIDAVMAVRISHCCAVFCRLTTFHSTYGQSCARHSSKSRLDYAPLLRRRETFPPVLTSLGMPRP